MMQPQGVIERARVILEESIAGPNVMDCITDEKDRLHCYVLLSSVLNNLKQDLAAEDVMMEAFDFFKGTQTEIEAVLELSRWFANKQPAKAVKILSSVKKVCLHISTLLPAIKLNRFSRD